MSLPRLCGTCQHGKIPELCVEAPETSPVLCTAPIACTVPTPMWIEVRDANLRADTRADDCACYVAD